MIKENKDKTKKNKWKKVYFVSYAYEKGFGQVEIFSNNKKTTYDVILEFRNTIKKLKPEIKEIVILFFKELDK